MGAIVKARHYYKNPPRNAAIRPKNEFIEVPFTVGKRLALVPRLGKKRRLLATVIVLETEKSLLYKELTDNIQVIS